MRYLFRDVTYQGATIRFLKHPAYDSDGSEVVPISALLPVASYIEGTHPAIRVVLMAGCSSTVTPHIKFLTAYHRVIPRQSDEHYQWQEGTFEKK